MTMMIESSLPFLTQFFFILSAFIMLPLTVIGFIYSKVTGQIVFRIEKAPSLFEQKKSNPAVKGEMPWLKGLEKNGNQREESWYEEQRSLFEEESIVTSKPQESPLSAADFTPAGERRHEESPKRSTEDETETQATVEENKPEEPFTLKEGVLEVEVSEDVEKTTSEGIPIKIAKGTKVKVVAPGFTIVGEEGDEEKEKEKEKKVKDLSEDAQLGAVG